MTEPEQRLSRYRPRRLAHRRPEFQHGASARRLEAGSVRHISLLGILRRQRLAKGRRNMTPETIILRLSAAAVIGCLIGLNRFEHRRYIGVRTLGLVSLGAAGLVVAALETGSGSDQIAAASRIIQGIVTGIGFLGAGVIVQGERSHKVHGLTTAATVWVAAAAGALCGLGAWRTTVTLSVLVGLILVVGGPIERLLTHRYGSETDESHPPSQALSAKSPPRRSP